MQGGEIIGSILDEDAIDEFIVSVVPTFIGEGIPLIAPRHREMPLRLLSVQRFPTALFNFITPCSKPLSEASPTPDRRSHSRLKLREPIDGLRRLLTDCSHVRKTEEQMIVALIHWRIKPDEPSKKAFHKHFLRRLFPNAVRQELKKEPEKIRPLSPKRRKRKR